MTRGRDGSGAEVSVNPNNIHANIKIELRYSYTHSEFLDTLVRLKDG